MLTLIGREEMDNHVTVVHDEPALARFSIHAPSFLVILFQGFEYALGKRVQHPVTGAVADDEIIGKRCDIFDIEKQNILRFFVFQCVYDFVGKFECVQVSPRIGYVIARATGRSNPLVSGEIASLRSQ